MAWGVGSLGNSMMINSLSFITLYYLIQVVGLAPALAGVVMFVGKAIDFVIYPAVGIASDRTRSRWGRRRPYMMIGAPLSALAFVLLYTIPAFDSEMLRAAWAAAVLSFYAIAVALFFVPYTAQPAAITSDPTERNALMAWRTLFLMIGTLLGSAVTAMLVERFGGGRTGYATMAVILGCVILASLSITLIGTRRVSDDASQAAEPGLLRRLATIGRNRVYVRLVLVNFLQFIGMATISAVILFFVTLVMKRSADWLAIYGIGIIATAVLAMRPWVALMARFGKRTAFIAATVGYTLAMCTWLAAGPDETLPAFVARAVLIGLTSGGLLVSGQSMLLDAVQIDASLSGEAREATLMALYAFAEKAASAIGPLLVGLLFALYEFDPRTVTPGTALPQGARPALEIALVWIMVAAAVGMTLLLPRYSLAPDGGGSAARTRRGQG